MIRPYVPLNVTSFFLAVAAAALSFAPIASADKQNKAGGGAVTRSQTSSSTSRSVSISKNGKRISISQDDAGIVVKTYQLVNDEPRETEVRAANVADLKKFYPAAYELYKKHLEPNAKAVAAGNAIAEGKAFGNAFGKADGKAVGNAFGNANGNAFGIPNGNAKGVVNGKVNKMVNGKAFGQVNGALPQLDAEKAARDQILQMRRENANNPQLQGVFDMMLKELNKKR